MTVAGIARGLGVRVETVDSESSLRDAQASGMSQQNCNQLEAMFDHHDPHQLVGNPAALAMMLRRPATKASNALLRD